MAPGKLIVISAPSGSGKTTIAHEIVKRNPSLEFSVSATTRPKRSSETEGKDYFFLTEDQFQNKVVGGEFVEWEEIYGNRYGTLKQEVDKALQKGLHLLFDVDVKGGLSIKRRHPVALLIFIRPPSVEVLQQRLRDRKTEDEETTARRMARVPMELDLGNMFDHTVVNNQLQTAIDEVQTIVEHYLHQQ